MPFTASAPVPRTGTRSPLALGFDAVRAHSLALAEPLSAEDQCVQSMPDASPIKWHLAHTTWFFETLVLTPFLPGYRPFDERFAFLFNSYYEALGPRHPRPARGLLTRPSADEVGAYRDAVDTAMRRLLDTADADTLARAEPAITLGLHHEQQHQELMLTDVLHLLSQNPLRPAYRAEAPLPAVPSAMDWRTFDGGTVTIGHRGPGFAFDNEGPPHAVLLRPFRLADRPVSNGEYLEFVRADGYRDPQWWLSDGWAQVQAQGWEAPLYWADGNAGAPTAFTLHGQVPLDLAAPATHLSLYEAAAYAAWAGARLPTEFEWEAAAAAGLRGTGRVWEWTRSAYDPYPGFKPFDGTAAEYNGKFMMGQVVLRGGSVATPPGHVRPTYRNFFPPSARWQFSGLRLAHDA